MSTEKEESGEGGDFWDMFGDEIGTSENSTINNLVSSEKDNTEEENDGKTEIEKDKLLALKLITILNDECLIQEVQNRNTGLITFFCSQKIVKQLLDLLLFESQFVEYPETNDLSKATDEKQSQDIQLYYYKLPYIISEVILSNVSELNKFFLEKENFSRILNLFLDKKRLLEKHNTKSKRIVYYMLKIINFFLEKYYDLALPVFLDFFKEDKDDEKFSNFFIKNLDFFGFDKFVLKFFSVAIKDEVFFQVSAMQSEGEDYQASALEKLLGKKVQSSKEQEEERRKKQERREKLYDSIQQLFVDNKFLEKLIHELQNAKEDENMDFIKHSFLLLKHFIKAQKEVPRKLTTIKNYILENLGLLFPVVLNAPELIFIKGTEFLTFIIEKFLIVDVLSNFQQRKNVKSAFQPDLKIEASIRDKLKETFQSHFDNFFKRIESKSKKPTGEDQKPTPFGYSNLAILRYCKSYFKCTQKIGIEQLKVLLILSFKYGSHNLLQCEVFEIFDSWMDFAPPLEDIKKLQLFPNLYIYGTGFTEADDENDEDDEESEDSDSYDEDDDTIVHEENEEEKKPKEEAKEEEKEKTEAKDEKTEEKKEKEEPKIEESKEVKLEKLIRTDEFGYIFRIGRRMMVLYEENKEKFKKAIAEGEEIKKLENFFRFVKGLKQKHAKEIGGNEKDSMSMFKSQFSDDEDEDSDSDSIREIDDSSDSDEIVIRGDSSSDSESDSSDSESASGSDEDTDDDSSDED